MLMVAAGLAGWPMTSVAQDAAANAAAVAAAQRYEADYKRLEDAVEELAKAQVTLRQQLAEAKSEIARLREEVERNKVNPSHFASASDAQELAKKLRELDEKRMKDREVILGQLESDKKQTINQVKELLQSLPAMREPATTPTVKPKSSVKKPKTEPKTEPKSEPVKEGPQSEYKIQSGDTLSKIVAALNEHGIKVTQKQIVDANPGLNPNKLIKDKTIIIPAAPNTTE